MSNKRKAVPVTRSQKKAKTRSTLWTLQPKPEPTFDSFWTMLRGNEAMQQSFYSGLRDPISFTLKHGDWVVRQQAQDPDKYEVLEVDMTEFEENEITFAYTELAAPRSLMFKVPVLKWDNFVPGSRKYLYIKNNDGLLELIGKATRAGQIDEYVALCQTNVLAPRQKIRMVKFEIPSHYYY